MSKSEQAMIRAERCRVRMLRGLLAAEVRRFNRAERALARRHRQRHQPKEQRSIRSLMHELAVVIEDGHGSGSHAARSNPGGT